MNLIDTMILFDKPLEEFEWYCRTRRLKDNTGCIRLTGVSGIEKQHIIGSVSEDYDVNVIVLENDSKVAHFVEDYKFFNPDVVIYPSKDLIFYQADINGKQMLSERMCLLKKLILGEKVTFVTTPDALMTPMIPIEVYKDNCISVEVNGIAEENALAHKLVRMGYVKTAQVSDKGEFSVRGGIVDIFDLTCDNPIRIELWGDTIESIRFFDVSSQRSIETLDKIDIMPATEMILTTSQKESGYHEMSLDAQTLIKSFRESGKPEYASRTENLINDLKVNLLETDMGLNLESFIFYFYQNTNTLLEVIDKRNSCIYIDEPKHVLEHAGAVEYEFRESMSSRLEKGYILPGQASILRPVEEMAAAIQRRRFVAFAGLAESGGVFSYDKDYAVSSRNLMSYNGSFSQLVSDLKKMKKNGNRIVIVSPSRTRAKRLADDLTQEGVVASYTENENKILQKGEIYTFYGRLSTGFEYPEIGFTVISEADIFGSDKHKKKRKPKYGGGRKISGYDELKAGDYVIHVDHGLGIYRGIEKVEVEHVIKDYMKIEYKDGGSLFVLASNFDSVQFYAGKDAKQPKLNKLGTQEWNKTKAKVEKAVGEVAKDLVRLYAVRQEKIGYKYGPDTVWQKEFEELFPFDETMDQLEAIASTKDDMESTRVMDRLICGDVGFGKTEVAIRAAFKAVQENKQVAYLVPTTILAQQHYNTFVVYLRRNNGSILSLFVSYAVNSCFRI